MILCVSYIRGLCSVNQKGPAPYLGSGQFSTLDHFAPLVLTLTGKRRRGSSEAFKPMRTLKKSRMQLKLRPTFQRRGDVWLMRSSAKSILQNLQWGKPR